MRSRISELALIAVLILLVALIRIYYGGDRGLMVVWKGEPTFTDTFVDLSEIMKLSPDAIKQGHPAVHLQLVAMDILDDNVELQSVLNRRRRLGQSAPAAKSAPGNTDSQKPAPR